LILSWLEDKTVVIRTRARTPGSRGPSESIVDYKGGRGPFSGPASTSNSHAIASFLLRYLVEPTYGVSGAANGTFTQH
jgi:hypothetical protein